MTREELAARLLQNYDAACEELACLTGRQRQALTYAAKGFTQEAAAGLMGVTVTTVANHRAAVLRKMKRSMTECIALAAVACWI